MTLYDHPGIYDDIYGSFSDDVGLYTSVARQAGGPVCELGCGTGRVTIPVAKELGAGGLTVAIDTSPDMLAAARTKAQAAGGAAAGVDFREGSMLSPPTAPGAGWGTVIIALHSLSHLLTTADLRTALTAIGATLAPHGRLVFAIHNPDVVELADDGSSLTRVLDEYSGQTIYGSSTYDSAVQIETVRWYLSRAEQTELIEYQLRMIFPAELELLLEVCGLRIEDRWGWYDRSPFTSASGTQVVVARRA